MAVPDGRSRSLFARPSFQLWTYVFAACLEGYCAINRASHRSFGTRFWFFTVATLFFVLMASLVLRQRKKLRDSADNQGRRSRNGSS